MILTTILSNISFKEEIVAQQHKTARQDNHFTVDTVAYHYLYFSHYLSNKHRISIIQSQSFHSEFKSVMYTHL